MTTTLTPEFLLLELSLYKEQTIEDLKSIDSLLSRFDNLQFDSHCVLCNKDSTFKKQTENRIPESQSIRGYVNPRETEDDRILRRIQGISSLSFQCQRDSDHIYYFYFKVIQHKIMKVGQYPSIADLELHKIKKYRSLLKDDYRDFSKAIGLYSHGIGAGSYVYLRRIFENIINQQKQIAIESTPSLSEEEFREKKMDEKILYIKDHLPDLLVRNRSIYGILSKGIHELSEEQCLEMFPKLELGIEIILDWKLAEIDKQEKASRFSNFVSSAVEKLKN